MFSQDSPTLDFAPFNKADAFLLGGSRRDPEKNCDRPIPQRPVWPSEWPVRTAIILSDPGDPLKALCLQATSRCHEVTMKSQWSHNEVLKTEDSPLEGMWVSHFDADWWLHRGQSRDAAALPVQSGLSCARCVWMPGHAQSWLGIGLEFAVDQP